MKPLLTLLATHKTLAAGLVAGLALCAVPALAGTVTVKT